MALAFPKAGIFLIAWFAVAPLMYCTYRLSWRGALLSGFAFGLAFNAAHLYWIALFGYLPVVLLAVIQSIYVVAFVVLARALGSRLGPWGRMVLLPSLWVIVEWVSSLGITAFPWGVIGYSQHGALPLIQVSSVTGVWGVSFLLALSNAVLANVLLARKYRSDLPAVRLQAALTVAVFAAVWAFGAGSIAGFDSPGRPIRAAVVQGNILQNVPHDAHYIGRVWRTYRALTRKAAEEGARIVVWPESVVPGCIGRDPVLRERLTSLSNELGGIRLLVGGRDEGDQGQVYNCAYLIGPSGLLGGYAKVRLVPFGEFVILRDYLPLLGRYRVTPYDYSAGDAYNVLKSGSERIGAAICFESIFPQTARRLAGSGAQILCVITNDAWFGRTAAAEQHMSKSIFRAVENRRYVLRAAATGVSCIIDPCGRISARSGLFEEAVLVSDVRLIDRKSFCTNHGDWFVYLCLAVGLVLGAIARRAAAADRQRPASQRSPRRAKG